MLTFLMDLSRAVAIAGGLMVFTWSAAKAWDWLCGYRPPSRDYDA